MDSSFDVQANDCGELGVEIDLFHASDRYARNEDLAARLESTDVRKSGVHFVGGTTDGRAGTGLHGDGAELISDNIMKVPGQAGPFQLVRVPGGALGSI